MLVRWRWAKGASAEYPYCTYGRRISISETKLAGAELPLQRKARSVTSRVSQPRPEVRISVLAITVTSEMIQEKQQVEGRNLELLVNIV